MSVFDELCPICGTKSIKMNIKDNTVNLMQQMILNPPLICSGCDYNHYGNDRISLEEWTAKRDTKIDDLLND